MEDKREKLRKSTTECLDLMFPVSSTKYPPPELCRMVEEEFRVSTSIDIQSAIKEGIRSFSASGELPEDIAKIIKERYPDNSKEIGEALLNLFVLWWEASIVDELPSSLEGFLVDVIKDQRETDIESRSRDLSDKVWDFCREFSKT